MGGTRFYRNWYNRKMKNINLQYQETDLLIRLPDLSADLTSSLQQQCLEFIRDLRQRLEDFIDDHPEFLKSMVPVEFQGKVPAEVEEMAAAARTAGVGPMAAVAGLFAEKVGRFLLEQTGEVDEVIVENGGDIFLTLKENGLIGIYAGEHSPFSGKLALKIPAKATPLGICTSAGTLGPSLSLGRADAVVVLSRSTVLADAAATAVGNLVKGEGDIEKALKHARGIAGISGIVIIKDSGIGAWGQVEFVNLGEKI